MTIRILVLSFYYEPDLCAGSFRNTAIVRALSKKLSRSVEIDVITTLPNRYHGYRVSAPEKVLEGNIHIQRVALPSHKSGVFDQARSYLIYTWRVLRATRSKNYDVVFASSSRLMTAVLGAFVARRVRARLYLDVRDIFTDTIADLYAKSPVRFLLPLFRKLETCSIHSATRVNLLSPAFVDHFKKIDSSKTYRVFTNGIDEEVLEIVRQHGSSLNVKKEILYAGNIGAGQGLHLIIPRLAEEISSDWVIRIIGDGGQLLQLKESVSGMDNVIIEPPMERLELLKRYQNASVLLLHLNEHKAFEKVLPSKIFEYAATGKPILAGVGGYSAKFLSIEVDNVGIFPPGDLEACVRAMKKLKLESRPREEFIRKYSRALISDKLAEDILSCTSFKMKD